MTFRIIAEYETKSTNLDARAGEHGDVYTAEIQTSGRGRLDHKWISPPGENLLMSAVFSVAGLSPETIATFPLVVGLAVTLALQQLTMRPFGIKWPNDVLIDGRKICGILCELNGNKVIAGIGINVRQREFPPEIAARATSLAQLDCEASPEVVRDAVLAHLASLYARWLDGGFAAIHPQVSEADLLKDRLLAIRRTDADLMPLTGLCHGIAPDGTLLVGNEKVYAGEAHVLENMV